MDKVPVGRTISHAYQFLFGRFFQILGTAWLPALLYAGVVYVFAQTSVTWLAPLTKDSALLTHGILVTTACIVVGLILRAVIGISLTQEALGIRKDLALAHLVVGPRELRLVFAFIRLAIVVAILAVAVAAALRFGLQAANQYGPKMAPAPLILGKPPVVAGAVVLAVLIYIAYVLSILRLSFLLVPVAAVEKQARIARAWALSGGSAIRILLVLVGTFLPVAIIGGIAMYLLAGSAHAAAAHGAADAVARLHAMLQFYADHAMTLAVASGIATIVAGALMAGASASAYRTVTGHEEEETEDDDALVAPLIAPGHGHDDHGHGGHDSHNDHGHDDHGHGGHDDHGHGGGHDDHGHGGHEDHGHGGHDDHAGGHGDDHGHGGGHGDHGHGGGHDDHGGHGDDHGHGGHDDHGHDDHGHGHGHGDGHHHHAKAA
jgi:uncharacterized membrane protein YgcG